MINSKLRTYNYFTYNGNDGYGQPSLSGTVQGSIKMAIYVSSQSTQDNINYQDCNYTGLTTDKTVNDKMVIQYGNEKLKVLYVNQAGRFTQVFLKRI